MSLHYVVIWHHLTNTGRSPGFYCATVSVHFHTMSAIGRLLGDWVHSSLRLVHDLVLASFMNDEHNKAFWNVRICNRKKLVVHLCVKSIHKAMITYVYFS